MKTANKIALFYTSMTMGVVAVVSLLFCLTFAGRNEAALPYIGWLLPAWLVVCSLLIYFVGRMYANHIVNHINMAYHSEKSFISNASHELNNPLTAIQGECEISLLKERTPAEYQAALGRIATEAKRIIQLMKQLLFLSHGDKEILNNAVEPIFLTEFLSQFSASRVSFSPDSFAMVVNANPYLLKMAIGNIISNASKYSNNKPVEIVLQGSVLKIIDEGIGIPPEELSHIYQPFYRGSNTREYAGNGIGLSLSMRILQTYGARITVSSVVNQGTTVAIDFAK